MRSGPSVDGGKRGWEFDGHYKVENRLGFVRHGFPHTHLLTRPFIKSPATVDDHRIPSAGPQERASRRGGVDPAIYSRSVLVHSQSQPASQQQKGKRWWNRSCRRCSRSSRPSRSGVLRYVGFHGRSRHPTCMRVCQCEEASTSIRPQPQPHTTPPQKSLPWSLYYMFRDFALLAVLYFVYPRAEAYGLPGLFVWWNLAGKNVFWLCVREHGGSGGWDRATGQPSAAAYP